MKKALIVIVPSIMIGAGIWFASCASRTQIGQVKDEALASARSAQTFPAADEDYFHDMDGGVSLTADEIKGRNTWIAWSAGNDRMWDLLSVTSFGALDFLKTVSSHPSLNIENQFQ